MRKGYLQRGVLNAARGGNAIGKFSVTFTSKELDVLETRKFSLLIMSTLFWVEDAVHVVIDRIALEPGEVAVYFLSKYPDDFSPEERQNQTKEVRRTLLYRIKFLLRCLSRVKEEYRLFEQWRFSGIEFALDSLEDKIRQALGERAHQTFSSFYERLKKLWKAVSPELDSPEAVGRELSFLYEEVQGVFETLHRECERREKEISAEKQKEEQAKGIDRAQESIQQHLSDGFGKLDKKLLEVNDSIGTKLDGVSSQISISFEEIDKKIDAVANDIAAINVNKGKAGRKAVDSKIADICLVLWDTAGSIAEIRYGQNSKISYKAVFNYHQIRLQKLGVSTEEQFTSIVRNAQRRKSRALHMSGPQP